MFSAQIFFSSKKFGRKNNCAKNKLFFRFRKKMFFYKDINSPILHNHSFPTQPVRGSNCELGASGTQKRVRPLIFIGYLPMDTIFTSWSSNIVYLQGKN